MPFFKKRRVYKKKSPATKKRYARGGRKSSAVSSAVKSYVSRTIHSQIENKAIQVQVAQPFGNVINSPSLYIAPLTPYAGFISLLQGVGQNMRTGNEVRTRKVMLKYVLYPSQYNAVSNVAPRPCEIQLFLGYVKNSAGILPIPADFNALYQYNNTTNPVFGTILDLNQKFNSDYWTIKKYWTHKVGYSSANGTGNQPASQSYNNNDFKLNVVRKLDITKLYPKVLKFNDNGSGFQGAGLFFFYQAVAADGTTFNAATLPVVINWQLDLDYEDA